MDVKVKQYTEQTKARAFYHVLFDTVNVSSSIRIMPANVLHGEGCALVTIFHLVEQSSQQVWNIPVVQVVMHGGGGVNDIHGLHVTIA